MTNTVMSIRGIKKMEKVKGNPENFRRVTVWIDTDDWDKFGEITLSRSAMIRKFIYKKINRKKRKVKTEQ